MWLLTGWISLLSLKLSVWEHRTRSARAGHSAGGPHPSTNLAGRSCPEETSFWSPLF